MTPTETANGLSGYASFLTALKDRIRSAQVRAALSVNREVIALYWQIGQMIAEQQQVEGWGAKVIDRLALDLKNELPEIKGFSARNLKRMKSFYAEYPAMPERANPAQPLEIKEGTKLPQLVAQRPVVDGARSELVPQLVALLAEASLDLPWGHNLLLIEKVKDLDHRLWYMRRTVEQGWSRDVLKLQIESGAYLRQGQAITNFERTLPSPHSDLAQQTLKDPYNFDFLTLADSFRERELETALVRHLQDFLVELGMGFAFVGRQYRVEVGDEDFYIDLLFYHLKLRCYVVIELKRGSFRPEYAGKLNFYLNVVDDKLRHEHDQKSIGLILCQDRNKVVAEYALSGIDKAIGVSEYELTRTLPQEIKGSLPEIEEIEAELGGNADS